MTEPIRTAESTERGTWRSQETQDRWREGAMHGETDRSLGFGLVELTEDGMAREAVQRLNGSTWNGRTLIVSGGARSTKEKR